jgi:hypothetical protein
VNAGVCICVSAARREKARAVSWENRTVDGEVSHPLGEDALGYLTYTEDGHMCVAIMRPACRHFVARDVLSGSREEKAAAAETYVSYCGRYEFRGQTIIHHIELSLFPDWVGLAQERLAKISGDRLTHRPGDDRGRERVGP